MRKIISFVLFMSVLLVPQLMYAQNNPVKFTDIVPQLEDILNDLSGNSNQFENILSTMNRQQPLKFIKRFWIVILLTRRTGTTWPADWLQQEKRTGRLMP